MRGRCDPLDFILNGVSRQFAAKKIARAFIPEGNHTDPHWGKGAQNYLAAVMIFVKCDPRLDDLGVTRTMASVAEILSSSGTEEVALQYMSESKIPFVRDQAGAFIRRKKKAYEEEEEEEDYE